MKNIEYYCDRCGKLKEGHPVTVISVGDKEIRDVGWIQLHSATGFIKDLDLCEDCLNSFKGWFENRVIIFDTANS